MTTYFITRHPGACAWLTAEGITVDHILDHLELDRIQSGDRVIGTLPVHLAAEVCERGGRYLHLSLEIPAERRGTEFSVEDMRRFGARLEEYQITKRAEFSS